MPTTTPVDLIASQINTLSLSPPSNDPIQIFGSGINQNYFDVFCSQGFVPDITADAMDEFGRLAKFQCWGKKSKEYHKQRNICLATLAEDFESHYGNDVTRLNQWQNLCSEVYVDPIPHSITQCKKVSLSYLKGFVSNRTHR